MSKSHPKTWLCPICAAVECEYGKPPPCPDFRNCENPPHLTGQFYLDNGPSDIVKGTGISEIANADQ